MNDGYSPVRTNRLHALPDIDYGAFRRVRGLPLNGGFRSWGLKKPARRIERQAGFCFFKRLMIEAYLLELIGAPAVREALHSYNPLNPVTNA